MSARPLRPTDVVALATLRKQAERTEVTAHAWPVVEPENGRLPVLGSVSAAIGGQVSRRRVWVSPGDSQLEGVLIATPRAGGLAWDVEHLHADPNRDEIAVELLEKVVSHAGSRGGRRVFIETPMGDRGLEVTRRAGFERYTSATLFRLERGFKLTKSDAFEARPRLRADEEALFQLYNAAVPAPVRAAEAMTLEEWQGLHRGARAWRPAITGSRQQFVWDLGASLVGWLEVVYGQHSQLLQLQVHPRYEEATDKLLSYALAQTSPKAPVYLAVREYQTSLASALQSAGFSGVGRSDLHVKLLAVRVKESALVPARMIGA